MTWYCRFCSRALWWPIWSAVSSPDNDHIDPNLRDNDIGNPEDGTEDVTGYHSATDTNDDNDDEDDDSII